MNEKEKKEILNCICEIPNFKNLTVSMLQRRLSNKGHKNISMPTIYKYKSMLVEKAHEHYLEVGLPPTNYDEIIKKIITQLSRNKKKTDGNLIYRKRVHAALLKKTKEKSEKLIKISNNFVQRNKELKEIKNEIFKELNDIPLKTLKYIYNDEAKKEEFGLLPKRCTVTPELINKIKELFNNGVMASYIMKNFKDHILEKGTSKHIVEIIKQYIKENYEITLSASIIRRYFYKDFKPIIKLCACYKYNDEVISK